MAETGTSIAIPNLKQLQEFSTLKITITSPETKSEAEEYLIKIDKAAKKLAADVKVLKAPYKKEIDNIDEAAKPWKEILEARATSIKNAIIAYNNKVRAAVQAANAKAFEKYEKKVDKAVEKAVEAGKPIPLILPPTVAAEPPKTSQAEGGKLTEMMVKKWRIPTVDYPEKVTAESAQKLGIPLKYFYLDTTGIGKIVKSGGEVPGIEVYEETTIAVRADKED